MNARAKVGLSGGVVFGLAAVFLLAAAPASADDSLASVYRDASAAAAQSRADGARRSVDAAFLPAAAEFSAESFVPQGCSVQSWCLIKATDCFVGLVDQPEGLWQGHAQYSVVRRAVALCPTGDYGAWQTQVFMSPVEPVPFSSAVETTRAAASSEALNLCVAYRKDWVSAAPVCPAQ
ncbi:MAG: hypothetical protein HKL90_04135 [Elusimicrobia bacterium]|nr:hypothetical protein [Elusimicrobiota bacterium]